MTRADSSVATASSRGAKCLPSRHAIPDLVRGGIDGPIDRPQKRGDVVFPA